MPELYLLGGPNGAGKTTAAMHILPAIFECREFVNADEIARGVSPLSPGSVDVLAGRIMLQRLEQLRAAGADFALEATLASRSLAGFLRRCKDSGYRISLLFFWLRSPDLAIGRIAERQKAGGHFVPDDTVVRRYYRGIRNFRTLYAPLTDSWICYDNSGEHPRLVASTLPDESLCIHDGPVWDMIEKQAKMEEEEDK